MNLTIYTYMYDNVRNTGSLCYKKAVSNYPFKHVSANILLRTVRVMAVTALLLWSGLIRGISVAQDGVDQHLTEGTKREHYNSSYH